MANDWADRFRVGQAVEAMRSQTSEFEPGTVLEVVEGTVNGELRSGLRIRFARDGSVGSIYASAFVKPRARAE